MYLFGSTEPQLVQTKVNPSGEVLPIPVVVAVVAKKPPPSLIGIKSVQRTEEEILPMEKLKMGWFPCLPVSTGRGIFKPRIFALKCEQRRARIGHMNEDDVKKYEYVLPYILFPEKEMEEETVDTVVNVMVDLEGLNKPLVFEYDWEMDDLDEFVPEKLKEEEIDEKKHGKSLRAAIEDQVAATKAKYREERAAKRKRIEEIDEAERESLRTMQIYKFYPDNEEPDVSKFKTKYINRYYGHAHHLI